MKKILHFQSSISKKFVENCCDALGVDLKLHLARDIRASDGLDSVILL